MSDFLKSPMPITREYSAERINYVLNHPDVRPWVADESEGILDISRQVENKRNVLLMGEYGGCFFAKLTTTMYEVHTQVLPEGRGAWLKDFLRAVRHYIFTRTDAVEVVTRVPLGHLGAKHAAKYVGMKHEFTRPDGCKFKGEILPVEIYSERIQDWASEAPYLVEKGQWLHDRMHEAGEIAGITEVPHDDDENHNRYVGATLEMVYGGQCEKAVAFYNRWALMSRHATIELLSASPPVIKFDVGIMRLTETGVEIVP